MTRRAQRRCEYCLARQDVAGYTFHLEHIIPSSRGGAAHAGNRALACSPCNLAKGVLTRAIDPSTGAEVRLFDPRQDEWATHFAAHPQSGRLRGLTSIGRATVMALGLNGDERIATRRLWAAAGWWP